MSTLSAQNDTATRIWLVDANPLGLEEPPLWWQTLVFDYDKMLRVLPSQREHVYRLCRLVRQEVRLGLQAMVVHDHPDTRACIKFGVVPVAALHPWAIRSNKIIRDLAARDTWRQFGGDPNKLVDAIEQQEADDAAKQQQADDEHQDDVLRNAYRAIRYGRPDQVYVHERLSVFAENSLGVVTRPRTMFRPDELPPLPALPDQTGSQNGNRLSSALPPEGTVTPTPTGQSTVILTDL
jgi:hypothetical protein